MHAQPFKSQSSLSSLGLPLPSANLELDASQSLQVLVCLRQEEACKRLDAF